MTPADQAKSKIDSNPILANAFRLMTDAKYLSDTKSYASAVALGCLSIEEIGKYLLALWSSANPDFSYDTKRLHLSKQAAVASMLLADRMRGEYRTSSPAENLWDWLKAVGKAINLGFEKESSTFEAILSRDTGLNIVRQAAMYYDEDRAASGLSPDKIDSGKTAEVLRMASRSFAIITDDKTLSMGFVIFLVISHDIEETRRAASAR